LKPVKYLILLGFLAFFFQNCTRVSFVSTSQKASDKIISGSESVGGEVYDGKIVLYHYVEGFQCEGRFQPESILIRVNFTDWVLIKNTTNKCAELDQIPVSGVIYDANSKQAQYKGLTFVTPILCDSTLVGNYGGGTGSSLDPYAICSLAQWSFFGSDPASWNKSFKMYSDLDFTSTTFATFKSIGNITNPFTGSYDGNNFKILNLNLLATTEHFAIFNNTDANATFSNLTLENIWMRATERISGLVLDHGTSGTLTFDHIKLKNVRISIAGNADSVAALVGASKANIVLNQVQMNDIIFDNPPGSSNSWGSLIGSCEASIKLTNISGANIVLDGGSIWYGGGLVGSVQQNGTFADINVTGLNRFGSGAGGLVYRVGQNIDIKRVHLAGMVSGVSDAAGLVAANWGVTNNATATISDSSFEGPVNAAFTAGGLLGLSFDNNVSITRSYYKGTIGPIWRGTGGGLIAQAQSATNTNTIVITDSYAISDMSNVDPNEWVTSGLIGHSEGHVSIQRSYYVGRLTGTAPRACIIKDTSKTATFQATDVYFDSTLCTANATTVGVLTGVLSLSSIAMQTGTAFPNWLPDTWFFKSGQYPKLVWEP
jgi:hypothetical protein